MVYSKPGESKNMKTNLEKYNYYYDLMQKSAEKYINNFFKDKVRPTRMFEIVGYYKLRECIITDITYRFKSFHRLSHPTREDVKRIKGRFDVPQWYEPTDIILHYTYKDRWESSKGKIKTASITGNIPYCDVLESNTRSFELNIKMQEELDRRMRLYKLKSGDVRCTYCGKAVQKEKAIKRTIINYKQFGPKGKEYQYCSSECGVHDQMAHEG